MASGPLLALAAAVVVSALLHSIFPGPASVPATHVVAPHAPAVPSTAGKGDRGCPVSASLVFRPTAEERRAGCLAPARLTEAVATFRACGVVAIEGAVPLQDVDAFRAGVTATLEPLLASRGASAQSGSVPSTVHSACARSSCP
jgi:hypothetical protein